MARFLQWHDKDGYAILTIDRPEALNALNEEVLEELSALLRQHEQDIRMKALIVTGSGRAFVAGADISAMQGMSPREAKLFSLRGHEVMQQLADFPVPVIAAINGFALGGGLELALACDIRLGSSKAKLGQPEVTLGITPGFAGTARLGRIIGPAKAKELLFTGRMVDATEAMSLGLLNHVYQPEELLPKSEELAQTISKNSGVTLRLLKSAANGGCLGVGTYEAEMFSRCFSTLDQKEGMQAFLEKRKPDFRNR
ncbi:MAG TPA: enoyl-CoA hydratase-related protein [Bacillota bacterium]|nr:enoyl-CoA hydratase-related protein [Bacillota bacterium]